MKQEIKEIWKDIPGYDGIYKVSNKGRVKRIRGNGKESSERILKGSVSSHGYLDVCLSYNGKRITRLLHQLVAQLFLDHTPQNHILVVHHIDRNIQNNCVDNLEIVTTRQNTTREHIKSSSKYVGVYFNKNAERWQASIMDRKERVYIGLFHCEAEAGAAYQRKLKEINETEI